MATIRRLYAIWDMKLKRYQKLIFCWIISSLLNFKRSEDCIRGYTTFNLFFFNDEPVFLNFIFIIFCFLCLLKFCWVESLLQLLITSWLMNDLVEFWIVCTFKRSYFEIFHSLIYNWEKLTVNREKNGNMATT